MPLIIPMFYNHFYNISKITLRDSLQGTFLHHGNVHHNKNDLFLALYESWLV